MEVKSISSFQVHCAEDLSEAYGRIVYWNADGVKDTFSAKLISAWANPKSHKCIRAHFKLEMFRNDLVGTIHKAFYRGLLAVPDGLPVIDENHTMTAWQKGSTALVRYGSTGRSYPYTDRDTGQTLYYFSCKQVLIREFLDFLRRWNPIAGMELVDFNVVKDEWLEGIGAIKLPDVLKCSASMWMADFSHIFREMMHRHMLGTYQMEQAAKIMLLDIQKQISEEQKHE